MKEETKLKISLAMKGRKLSEETRGKMSLAQIGNKKAFGKKMSEEAKGRISVANKGKKRSQQARETMSIAQKGRRATPESKLKMSLARKGKKFTPEHRKRLALSKLGSKSHFWKGGITPIHNHIRQTVEYKLWREAVYQRDNYKCLWCGVIGGRLNADHIKPFSLFPELRFCIDNGRTLCVDCHKRTNTYGRKTI